MGRKRERENKGKLLLLKDEAGKGIKEALEPGMKRVHVGKIKLLM